MQRENERYSGMVERGVSRAFERSAVGRLSTLHRFSRLRWRLFIGIALLVGTLFPLYPLVFGGDKTFTMLFIVTAPSGGILLVLWLLIEIGLGLRRR